jgi:hypothetical protein
METFRCNWMLGLVGPSAAAAVAAVVMMKFIMLR